MNNETTIKEATKLVWGTNPAGWTYGDGHEKGTKEFFTSVVQKRFTQECDWMEEIIDYKQLKDKKVLEIGCGAGYDAYQFVKQGANYTGIDITPDNPKITKKHLELCGFEARTFEMDAEQMTLDEKFDYIFSFGVLHHTPNIGKALKNIHNLLADNGQAQIIVYYKHSIFYMLHVVLYDWILKGKFLKISLADRRSQIEYTLSDAKALVNVYSKKEFAKICNNAGFNVIKTDVRKLVIDDFPGFPLIRKLYPYIPTSWLKALSKRFGWYLSMRLVKK